MIELLIKVELAKRFFYAVSNKKHKETRTE